LGHSSGYVLALLTYQPTKIIKSIATFVASNGADEHLLGQQSVFFGIAKIESFIERHRDLRWLLYVDSRNSLKLRQRQKELVEISGVFQKKLCQNL
jgi:hypothetical protein